MGVLFEPETILVINPPPLRYEKLMTVAILVTQAADAVALSSN